jgi:hypothetical protein
VQLNAGRVEISVPYHIGIVVVLVMALVVLAAFRLGQKFSGTKVKAAAMTAAPVQVAKENASAETAAPTPSSSTTSAASASSGGRETAQPAGDNLIVLKYSTQQAELDKAKDFFVKNGIDVAVWSVAALRDGLAQHQWKANGLPKGDGYLLITNGFYGNPDNPATDGYAIKQKISELGKKYKPAAPKFFTDAYGVKLSRVGQQEKQ